MQKTNVRTSFAHTPKEDPFNHSKFLGADQEYRYKELASKSIWSERTFNINPEGNPLTLPDDELCQYSKRLSQGDWNFELVKDTLVLPGRTYVTNASGRPIKFNTWDLNTSSQVLMTLVLYNIRPKSHTSSIPMNIACLLYYIIDDKHVDMARIIANEMKMIVSRGHHLGN
ncbi:hypothetical protein KIW84_011971 [Lathyrus oleraceus]|uniref:Putative plant transposon protein domain-containing protein n=1 Tax=Pisum sativum TaxID=3888 RepID=A0A9D5GW02_PEA|nr:hypothetical protein KIW84_011971 [Pisum sativum]